MFRDHDYQPAHERRVSSLPVLPTPREQMDFRAYGEHGEARDAAFYLTALEYGHYLWQRGFAALAVFCLDRAMGAELAVEDPIAQAWPSHALTERHRCPKYSVPHL